MPNRAWLHTYTIDAGRDQGQVRNLLSVNGGPLSCSTWLDHSAYIRQLAPPTIRLHDAMWPGTVVDLHHVFPDFSKDPADPASYAFAETDRYVKAVLATGSRPVYRLGHSAGGFGFGRGWPGPVRTPGDLKPEEYDRWVAIALGVMRHYRDGWASGFDGQVYGWEVWNEANAPGWWNGDAAGFADLYIRVARAAKDRWPEVRIGGGAFVTADPLMPAELVARFDGFITTFVERVAAAKAPLDFLTWHAYLIWPETVVLRSRHMRDLLKRNGLGTTEDWLSEWSITGERDMDYNLIFAPGADPMERSRRFGLRHGGSGGAGAVCVLSLLQDTGTSAAHYYSADANPFGLFTGQGQPKPDFHSLRAFARLAASTPQRLPVVYTGSQVCPDDAFDHLVPAQLAVRGATVLAGRSADGNKLDVLLANMDDACWWRELHVDGLDGSWILRRSIADETRHLEPGPSEPVPADGRLRVQVAPGSVVLLELERAP